MPDQIIEILNGQMSFLLKKNLNNPVALGSVSQPFAAQKRAKGGIGIGWKGGVSLMKTGLATVPKTEREKEQAYQYAAGGSSLSRAA